MTKLVKVAFVFPGQGAQTVGMGRDLYDSFPAVRAMFEEVDESLGYPLSRIILDGPEDELRLTANAQPAIVLVSSALHHLLDLTPAAVAGHSLGEYSALVAAQSLSLADAATLVHKRGTFMQQAVPAGEGAMVALIGGDDAQIESAVRQANGTVDIANFNAPGQIVIAGSRDATIDAARQSGARQTIELPVSAPFHCRLMQPAEEKLAIELESVRFSDPIVPLFNNVDAARATTAAEVRDGLRRQVSRPVRWTTLIERMIADGIESFVEIGPGNVLSGLIRRIDRSVQRLSVNDAASVESVRALLTA